MDLQVNRSDLHQTRLVDLPPVALEPGQARLGIDTFGLSANNITYAVIGDLMQYWAFFPAPDGWGRVPAWGYATVTESRHDDVAVGQRVFGYLPMSTELVVTVGKAGPGGFADVAEHRRPMAGAYNRYVTADPDVAPGSVAEARRMVLYPLFFTSFLVDDFLADHDHFGASVLVISSASAKTALGVARQAADREGVTVVGLTSPGNVAFVEGLGIYDRVLAYGTEADLPDGPAAYVDVSGSGAVRAAVHDRYGRDLRHDMILGGTHHDQGGDASGLPGPAPEFFFAPSQIAKRAADWGQDVLDARLEASWQQFGPWTDGWLEFRPTVGLAAVSAAYLDLLDNRLPPTVAPICTPADPA